MSDVDEHTPLADFVVEASSAPPTVPEQVYPPCTQEEETFALAVAECGGNIPAAYRMAFGPDVAFPNARGKEMLSRPQVALKLREITDSIQDAAIISVGAHLNELAVIRDLAKDTGQLKTALAAERARGEAVGIYQRHERNGGGGGNNTQVVVQMLSRHDVDI